MKAPDKSLAEQAILEAIEAACSEADPLDGLVEAVAANPGAAFAPDVLAALGALAQSDRAAFEQMRAALKNVGCRVSALDQAIQQHNGAGSGRAPTQADTLIALTQDMELFHDADWVAYADVEVDGHRQTWDVRSKAFRLWLTRRHYEQTGGAPNAEAMAAAVSVIEARARFDAPEGRAFLRVGSHAGRLYVDLGNASWDAVEIDATGWRMVSAPPVRFRRSAGQKALPAPVRGGSIEALRTFLNIKSDADFVLAVAWLLACLRDHGPYPVLVVAGEQGSAKSTFAAMLRALIDPNSAPLRTLPREARDLFIAAKNGHVLAFDNVSGLPTWVSDTLCRLATGGGFAVRRLHSDQDEVLFDAARPVILNGIEDFVTRPDLADRAIFLTLAPIAEAQRQPEKELWAAFEAERARLLGVLFDAVARGLAEIARTTLTQLPRMADFAIWAAACETALWPKGTFEAAYARNREEIVEGVLEGEPIAAALRGLMAERAEWEGTATSLLQALGALAGQGVTESKAWPREARSLAGYLRRIAPFLRRIGLELDFERKGRGRSRMIHIARLANFDPANIGDERPSASSASATEPPPEA